MNIPMTFRALTCIMFCIAGLLTGCQDDDIPALEYRSSGFIKGTIHGTSSNGDTLIEDFNYTQYPRHWNTFEQNWASIPYYTVTPPLVEGYSATTFVNLYSESMSETGYAQIMLYLLEEDPTKITLWSVFIRHREQKDNQTVLFDSYRSQSEITEFSFDRASGRIKGKFTITGAGNLTGNDATVEGVFDMTIKQLVR